MAEKKDTVKNTEKRVLVHLPRAPQGEAQQVWMSINGRAITIQRGVDVEIPECFAALLKDNERAEEAMDRFISERANNG